MASFTYSTDAGDCWGTSGGSPFSSTSAFLYLGGNPGDDANTTDWIPFVVPDLPKGAIITSATLRVVAYENSTDSVNIRMGCEAADNPSAPTSGPDVLSRVLTSAFTDFALANFTTGTEYSYDVTAAVQEVINRSGWVAGNTLAILIKDNDANNTRRHLIASFEHATLAEPKLDIVVSSFIPEIIEG